MEATKCFFDICEVNECFYPNNLIHVFISENVASIITWVEIQFHHSLLGTGEETPTTGTLLLLIFNTGNSFTHK